MKAACRKVRGGQGVRSVGVSPAPGRQLVAERCNLKASNLLPSAKFNFPRLSVILGDGNFRVSLQRFKSFVVYTRGIGFSFHRKNPTPMPPTSRAQTIGAMILSETVQLPVFTCNGRTVSQLRTILYPEKVRESSVSAFRGRTDADGLESETLVHATARFTGSIRQCTLVPRILPLG